MYKILLSLLSIFFITQLFAKDMTKSLFKSIQANDMVSFKEILLKASDLNVVDDSGKTPILIATSLNNAEMVSLLLDKGVDPNILDSRRNNSYLLAGANGNLEILKYLHSTSFYTILIFYLYVKINLKIFNNILKNVVTILCKIRNKFLKLKFYF